MKTCPYCAEDIQSEAIKCKHCGEFLNKTLPPAIPTTPKEAQPWYFRPVILIILLLSVGPLALPLVWLSPTISKKWKIIISILTIILTYLLYLFTEYAVKSLYKTLETLQQMNGNF